MAATAFYAGLAGPTADHGRLIAKLECWGAGEDDENWRAASAWRQLNLPQIRLEPVLKDHADALSPGRIRFSHELTALQQDDEGVTATVRDLDAGTEYTVRCQVPHRRRRRPNRSRTGRHHPRRPRRRHPDGDAARDRRLLRAGRATTTC